MTDVEWIESGGGPLLLAPRSATNDWHGAQGPGMAGPQTDYARACSLKDEIGVIHIGSRPALVLGDEPDRTALIPVRSDALLVRWRWADSERSLIPRLLAEHVTGGLAFSLAGQLATTAEEYFLFDSACSGTQIDQYLSIPLHAGHYIVESANFKPDRATFALVHRLRFSKIVA